MIIENVIKMMTMAGFFFSPAKTLWKVLTLKGLLAIDVVYEDYNDNEWLAPDFSRVVYEDYNDNEWLAPDFSRPVFMFKFVPFLEEPMTTQT